jgi:hypothetical protein
MPRGEIDAAQVARGVAGGAGKSSRASPARTRQLCTFGVVEA